MRSILDQILDNMNGGGAKIVSQQHDTSAINWVNGLSDPGEMIACGYLPEIRRQAGEQDEAYAERIRPIVMALPAEQQAKIMGSAIRRASLDTSNGKVSVMVAGKPAWHRLGVNVESAVTSADAMRLANLNWRVDKLPLYYTDATGTKREAPDVYGIVRDDTGEMLGNVGSRYTAIQNHEAFDFLDNVLGQFGAKYETAGAIYGGAKVWMLVHLPNQRFTVGHGDTIEPYALFTNPHDGSGKAFCYPTSERVVCANTFRVAQRDKGKGIGIRHSGNVKAKIADAQLALGLAVKGFEEFKEQADSLAHAKLANAPAFVNGVLDAVLDMTAAEALKGADALAAALAVDDVQRDLSRKAFQRQIDARQNVLEDILTRYESERCGINGMRGTAWAAFNAVTEFADHSPLVRYKGSDENRASRRMESTIAGEADEIKQVAFTQALAASAV